MSKKKRQNKKELIKEQDAFKVSFSEVANQIIADFDRSQRPQNFTSNFVMPEKIPMITGDKMTSDSLPINNCNFGPFDKINRTLLNSRFLGYAEYALLSQNGVVQKMAQCLSRDAVREWITIFSKKTGNTTGNTKIAEIEAELNRLNVKQKMRHAVEQMVLFGGCKLYPKITGDDDKIGGDELETPLYIEKVAKGSLEYLKIIEPQYATPGEFNANNPLLENFYEPTNWIIANRTIHHSRLGHFRYNNVPTLLKPVYWFNGIPLVQLCLDYLYGFENIRQNIIGISGRYNINIFKTNMTSLLNFKGGSSFQAGQDAISRLKLAQALQNNYSIFALDNNPTAPEEWQQFSMTMTGLVEILNENAGYLCAVSSIPEEIFFMKKSKGGIGHNDDNAVRLYYDNIGSFQDVNLKEIVDWNIQLVQMNLYGKIDPDISFKFNPLWKKSDLETWQIQEIKQKINTAYFAEGILEGNEIREAVARDPDSGYAGLANLPDEDFEDAKQELEKESTDETA